MVESAQAVLGHERETEAALTSIARRLEAERKELLRSQKESAENVCHRAGEGGGRRAQGGLLESLESDKRHVCVAPFVHMQRPCKRCTGWQVPNPQPLATACAG